MPFQPKAPVSEAQALQKLAALCSRSEHSSGEILEKMRRWQLPPDARKRVLQRLTAERYIDDSRFARLFVNDRLRFASWGERKILAALRQKGIGEATADEAIRQVGDDEWLAVLRKVIAAKRRTTKASSARELNVKLLRHALSRGFTVRLIERCIDPN